MPACHTVTLLLTTSILRMLQHRRVPQMVSGVVVPSRLVLIRGSRQRSETSRVSVAGSTMIAMASTEGQHSGRYMSHTKA